MTTAVATKTRAEICYEAVEAYRAENSVSATAAFKALSDSLGASPGAVSQAYYHHKQKMAGPKAPPKRQRAAAGQERVVTGTLPTVEQFQALLERMTDLEARERSLVVREQKLAAFEAALRAAQA